MKNHLGNHSVDKDPRCLQPVNASFVYFYSLDTRSNNNFSKLLEELGLKDNYFSVRGELVFVNTQKKEIVIKVCTSIKSKNLKNKNFKLVIKGELSLELLHSFVSLDINRDGNSLQLINYELIEKNLSKNN